MKKWLNLLAFLFVLLVGTGFGYGYLDKWFPKANQDKGKEIFREVLTEENAVITVVDKVTPSVVTVVIKAKQFFTQQEVEQDIGTGFVISSGENLVATNKHVVDNLSAEYKVITADNRELKVEKIYRDLVNDLAILQVEQGETNLIEVKLGDSDQLKVGQVVVAIGTALGEFRSTVTTGVISGLGRGISAGSPFGGSERLDNVIQTDAAINPGNSGGPLLNSSAEVVGVNVAVSQAGQNIGFAIPINVIKEAIDNFNTTGKFSRPYLGVRYQLVDKKTAILNTVPQGVFIVEVVAGSPAEVAGIKDGDIITEIDGVKLTEENSLVEVVSGKTVGTEIKVKVFRDDKEIEVAVLLSEIGE